MPKLQCFNNIIHEISEENIRLFNTWSDPYFSNLTIPAASSTADRVRRTDSDKNIVNESLGSKSTAK